VGRPGPATPPAAAEVAGTVVFGTAESAEPAPPPQLTPEQLRSPRRTPGPGTNTRIQVAVRHQTRTLRRVTIGLAVLTVAAAGAYFWKAAESERRLTAQREALLAQVDTLMLEMGTVTSGSAGLRAALDSARADAEQLRHQLTQAPNDAARIEQLEQQLAGAMRQQRTLAGAAALDARGIAARNHDALAMVFVQFPSGKVYTGTAFAVRSDPLGGLLVTNKHVVTDSSGEQASRIGVVFEGTRQNFKADLVALSDNTDLALIRASVHRGFPTVEGLADSAAEIPVGDPAVILGFPLGLDLAGGEDWTQVGVASTLTLGTVSRTLPALLQLDSYGAQGASGSPIFNRSGRVIGVLYGGAPGSNGRIIYSVPVRFVHQLLEGQ
jgi:S1-C subfamily serine protease